jgi:hypothetical protein
MPPPSLKIDVLIRNPATQQIDWEFAMPNASL